MFSNWKLICWSTFQNVQLVNFFFATIIFNMKILLPEIVICMYAKKHLQFHRKLQIKHDEKIFIKSSNWTFTLFIWKHCYSQGKWTCKTIEENKFERNNEPRKEIENLFQTKVKLYFSCSVARDLERFI